MAYMDSIKSHSRPPALTALGYMRNPSLSPLSLSPTLTATSFSASSYFDSEAPSGTSEIARDSMVDHGGNGVQGQAQALPVSSMGNLQQEVDFDQFFNFDGFDSGNESHSPATASPTRTPPPFHQSLDNVGIASHDTSMGLGAFDASFFGDDFAYLNNKENAVAGPSTYQAQPADVVVKQEPVEFGWNTIDMGLQPQPPASLPTQAISPYTHTGNNVSGSPSLVQPPPAPTASPSAGGDVLASFGSLPFEQQVALQQMLFNIMSFQANMGGFANMETATPAPSTIDPSKIFAPGPIAQDAPPTLTTAVPAPVTVPVRPAPITAPMPPTQTMSPPNAVAGPSRATTTPNSNDHAIDEDDELVSIGEADIAMTGRGRSMSTFSSASGIDEKLDRLAPLNSIFSAGRGKGGKKGGGMSSVVRGEDEDLDDDDSWRPSAEEYKKLSSKEKRQLRNKLSARAFRNRRKDYIGTLEGHIKERDVVIDEMRSELQTSKSENQDLRRELEALKKSTMSIIHPATAVQAHPSQVPSVISALTMPLPGRPASGSTTPLSPAPRKLNTAPTPQFNPRKDLPANGRGRGAGGEGIFGGPPTICHTILTPDLPFGAAAGQRQNMNPRLSAPAPRGSIGSSPTSTSSGSSPYSSSSISTSHSSGSVYSHASSSAHMSHNALNLQQPTPGDDIAHNTFDQWMDANPFSIRLVDSYRRQMWSRLAREAQADKAGLVGDMRPKFYTEAHPSPTNAQAVSMGEAAAAAGLATAHITSKLAQSFIGAFTNTTSTEGGKGMGKMDGDKLTAVVTGRAHLKVVSASASAKSPIASVKTVEVSDKEKDGQADREMDLVVALGGLKLHSGPGLHGPSGLGGAGGLGARSDPLGFIGGFLRQAAHPTRA